MLFTTESRSKVETASISSLIIFPVLGLQVLSACRSGKVEQGMKGPRVHPSPEGHTARVWGRERIKDSAFGGLFQSDSHSRLVHRHCGGSSLETV